MTKITPQQFLNYLNWHWKFQCPECYMDNISIDENWVLKCNEEDCGYTHEHTDSF